MQGHRKGSAAATVLAPIQPQVKSEKPLYVDMDGTLLATDALWEMFVLLLKKRPTLLLQVPSWLMRGKAFLKRQIASHINLNPALLPYHNGVIALLIRERDRGRKMVLATASDRTVAESVARHVGLFSAVLASDGATNLAGRTKLAAILQHANGAEFDYAGNSSSDLPIWREASGAILVRPSRRLVSMASRTSTVETVLHARRSFFGNLADLAAMMRIYQWPKNVLLLVPLLLAHKVTDVGRIVHVLLAFAAFCLAASAVYIVNDLLDLESDRQHPDKRSRALASGLVPIPVALAILPLLVATSALIAWTFLPPLFAVILLLYLVTTTAYSLKLKRVAIVDVLVLTGLYTLRVLAGAVATDVPVSPWFLAFSMFFFLSLAFVKRYAELRLPRGNADTQDYLLARGYFVPDTELLRSLGPTSGYLAVAVLALYINSPEVQRLYSRPAALWLIEPLLLYWLTRVWFLAHRGQMHGDPVIFALTDRTSYVLTAMIGAIIVMGALA